MAKAVLVQVVVGIQEEAVNGVEQAVAVVERVIRLLMVALEGRVKAWLLAAEPPEEQVLLRAQQVVVLLALLAIAQRAVKVAEVAAVA